MRDLKNFIYSFVLEPPLSVEEISEFRHSAEPWASLAYLVHRAAEGDFSQVMQIEQLLRASKHALFWFAATRFAGMAGSWDTIERIAASFRAEPQELQYYMANMRRYGCNPSFTEPLLELHEAAGDDELRGSIAWNLSFLLEPENGLIWIGARESDKYGDEDDEDGEIPDSANMSFKELFAKKRDHLGYRETVLNAQGRILESGIRAGSAVIEGALLDARRLAMRILDRARSTSDAGDRIIEEIVFLSAMTGMDCSKILGKPGGLNTLDTCALVESVLADPKLDAMVPGRRYFLGHPVPD